MVHRMHKGMVFQICLLPSSSFLTFETANYSKLFIEGHLPNTKRLRESANISHVWVRCLVDSTEFSQLKHLLHMA